ncbi:hypothetical protein M9Y10_016173 [Tritrichomonas musculus]|uniref:PB1 domain-containing protein n=1 Tax=Tritrichomonas musculus TaxID=1915356 RepID=A0ABR2I6W1_9EUKA
MTKSEEEKLDVFNIKNSEPEPSIPNVIFRLNDCSELQTYFEDKTGIDIIKAFVSDGKHSLKDQKFWICANSKKIINPKPKAAEPATPLSTQIYSQSTPSLHKSLEKFMQKRSILNKTIKSVKSSQKVAKSEVKERTDKPKRKFTYTKTTIIIRGRQSSHFRAIDLSEIKTMKDLLEKANYDCRKEMIQVTYSEEKKNQTEPLNLIEEEEDQEMTRSIEFIITVYDKDNQIECKVHEPVDLDLVLGKSVRDIRDGLMSQFKADSKKSHKNFTKKLTKKKTAGSLKKKDFRPKTTNDTEVKDSEYSVVLISDKSKIMSDYVDQNKMDFSQIDKKVVTNKIYVFFLRNDVINFNEISLNLNPVCIKYYEKPVMKVQNIDVVDLKEPENVVCKVEVGDMNLNAMTVSHLNHIVSEKMGKSVDDISLFAVRDGSTVYLADDNEIVQKIIDQTGSFQFLYTEVTNRKSMPPRMMRNFRNISKGMMTDDEINNIYIHSGRSSDISISTVQFYA